MAYAYCYNCDEPFAPPELADAMRGHQICSECEETRSLSDYEIGECANDIEQKLKLLTDKVFGNKEI